LNRFEKFTKILVPIDGSDNSMDAIDYGIALAKKYNAKLVILNVIYTPASTFVYTKQAWFDEFLKKARDEAEKWFEKIRKNATEKGVEFKTHTVEEMYSIAAGIVKYAEDENVDLIIIGSTGKTGFKRLLLGSVASDVLRHAICPVMVVK